MNLGIRGQGRIFIFGALGYFKLGGVLLKVCDDWCHANQYYTCSLHSLNKLLQFINILLCSDFPRYQKREPRQPLSIPPIGALRCHSGPKIQNLTPQTELNPSNTRNQWSFCQSVSFFVLRFIDGAVPAAVTWNNITWSVPALPLVKLDQRCTSCGRRPHAAFNN